MMSLMYKIGRIGERIVSLISRKSYGLTIEEVSEELKINRATASKYLAVLEAQDRILVRELGKAKLHYPKTKSLEVQLK
jgi:response regulator of citrate/malate metabolism